MIQVLSIRDFHAYVNSETVWANLENFAHTDNRSLENHSPNFQYSLGIMNREWQFIFFS